jgi:hypothetical protein
VSNEVALVGFIKSVESSLLVGTITADFRKIPGPQGPKGDKGDKGDTAYIGQVTGGNATSVFGGTFTIYGGDAFTVFN